MSKFDIATTVMTKIPQLGSISFKLQKFSPEILFGVGVVGVVAGTVLACKATLKVDGILEEAKNDLDNIVTVSEEDTEAYDENDALKDRTIVYTRTAAELAKTYLPAVTTLGLGIACFVGSHNIQHSRVAALGAAYKVAEKGFREYRNKIAEELGEDKEKSIYYGASEDVLKYTETLKNGKEKEIEKKVQSIDGDLPGHSRWFDKNTSRQWSNSRDYNLDFLKSVQTSLNDRLHLKGHVFLNEVYDALDLERCPEGQLVGWVDGNEDGSNYIDFGMSDAFYNSRFSEEYVNGGDNSYLLSFNVDPGYIYDQI